ncbi:hypothetical protein [Streptomyces sp. NPDC060194]|uniref:hypothetical protein n=1 Tax=Streptomyces sp. NPDC060194 TaxID=3347069 RepID=UPI00364EE5DD
MRPIPPGLPPADSRKWHGRRMWDELGYLRVRSLANPQWRRDVPWLIHWFRREREIAPPQDRALYDAAVAAARAYEHAPDDAAWDRVLAPVDAILARRQVRHLAAVRDR